MELFFQFCSWCKEELFLRAFYRLVFTCCFCVCVCVCVCLNLLLLQNLLASIKIYLSVFDIASLECATLKNMDESAYPMLPCICRDSQ